LIAGGEPLSQQEIAGRVGIDRTSMVALIDALQRKGLVVREPSPSDRRRNLIALTARGRTCFTQAEQVVADTEQTFLSALGTDAADDFRDSLRALLDTR
jgi:DNA-binding MarR family transcriptional regulator